MTPSFADIDGLPPIDFTANLTAAISGGRRVPGVLLELFDLMRGLGKMTPNEYFYYRLWERGLSREAKRRFVGKRAQIAMHRACNDVSAQQDADDKLRFHGIMTAAGLPVPELLAVVHESRDHPGVVGLRSREAIAAFLERGADDPVFAKPIDGKYSLDIFSVDGRDSSTGELALRGAAPMTVDGLAQRLSERTAGYLLQRRLSPHPDIAAAFGDRLWSVRILVLLAPDGPLVHRAVGKVPTGDNPADNYWRPGNMLAAIDLASGEVTRAVRGTGMDLEVNPDHSDTGRAVVGMRVPAWPQVLDLVRTSAVLLPGIRTQAWDIALAERPTLLEVNWGGDLNLPQLASGQGVLDPVYRAHLASQGYRA